MAVDFFIKDISSLDVARWIVLNCQFDRLYYYGKNRPIHVSLTKKPISQIILMQFKNIRVVPKKINKN